MPKKNSFTDFGKHHKVTNKNERGYNKNTKGKVNKQKINTDEAYQKYLEENKN